MKKYVFYFFMILGLENYREKDKLKANIFEDFEKQESWQSYTTLLFADIKEGK